MIPNTVVRVLPKAAVTGLDTRCIHSREEETRTLGDRNGTEEHEEHEKRIQVLDAHVAQYRLERCT